MKIAFRRILIIGLTILDKMEKMMRKNKKIKLYMPTNIYHHIMRNTLMGFFLIAFALFIGMWGYHVYEKMPWIDAFLNASMILSGMGPAATLTTTAGKLFAGLYALFSGLTFIAIVVILFSPAIHLFFRKIHLENKKDEADSSE